MDQVDWLLQHARRYPLLTPEQEIHLARSVQEWMPIRDKAELTPAEKAICKRGKRAYDTFFVSNIRLVVKASSWYSLNSGSMTPADLISEGMLGLHRAIEKYEPSLGYKFSTYAMWWIRQAISRGIGTKAAMVYMPDSAQQVANRARRYIAEQQTETGKTPSLEQVSEHLGVSVANLRLYLSHSQFLVSLDAPLKDDGNGSHSLVDVVEDPSSTLQIDETSELERMLPKVLDTLNPLQQDVVKRRYLQTDRDTYDVIAKDNGVSRERARQAHDTALRIMRNKMSRLPQTRQELRCA